MKLEYSTSARCKPEHLWNIFHDVGNWPQWHPAIGSAAWTEGSPWAPGSELTIELIQPRPFTLKPRVQSSSPPQEVVITGKSMGVTVEHALLFQPQPDGSTLLKTVVDLSGPATFFINDKMKAAGQQVVAELFARLKDEAERLAEQPAPSAAGTD